MLSLATRHGAINVNPLREVAKIPIVVKEVRALTLDEVIAIRKGIYKWQQRTGRPNGLHEKDILDVVDIMLATGARIREALAIRWTDVDLDAEKPTVTINGTVIKIKGMSVLKIQVHPKSSNSRQRYFLPSFAVEMLGKRQADTAGTNDLGLVFASSVGTIRDPNGFRKPWREVREALGYEWVTPHTFRKSVGTILANTQASPPPRPNLATPMKRSPASTMSRRRTRRRTIPRRFKRSVTGEAKSDNAALHI